MKGNGAFSCVAKPTEGVIPQSVLLYGEARYNEVPTRKEYLFVVRGLLYIRVPFQELVIPDCNLILRVMDNGQL